MMPVSCVIMDDEYLAVNVLQEYASRMEGLTVQKSFINPQEGLAWLQENTTDVLLLDIQMPWVDGFSLLEQLAQPPLVIFTTARHDYAVKAFELDVLDYLVKPISFERFEKAIERAREYLTLKKAGTINTPGSDALMIKSDYRINKILLGDIIYIEGLNEYVKIHTTSKTHITLASLKDLMEQLPAPAFLRIHKSYIINRSFVATHTASKITLSNDTVLPVGRVYKEEVMKQLSGS